MSEIFVLPLVCRSKTFVSQRRLGGLTILDNFFMRRYNEHIRNILTPPPVSKISDHAPGLSPFCTTEHKWLTATCCMAHFCETSHWKWKSVYATVHCSSVVKCGTPNARVPSSNPRHTLLKVRRKFQVVLYLPNALMCHRAPRSIRLVSNIKNIGRKTIQYQKIMDC